MKKILFGTIFLALIMAVPVPTMAMGRVDVGVSIPLPPPIGFAGPPEMVVLPETYIYVVPDSDVDIFFYGGWWWRPWNGRWYRSHYYNSGWGYYQGTPSFYISVPSGWRNDYRQRRWGGHQWNYQRIPHQHVQQNWQGWEKNKHWEKQNTWGVKGLKPQTQTRHPSHAIQPKPQLRDIKRQQSRPQLKEVKPEKSQQVRKVAKPRQFRQKSQPVKKRVRKAAKPEQSKQQEDKPERGQEGKQDSKVR